MTCRGLIERFFDLHFLRGGDTYHTMQGHEGEHQCQSGGRKKREKCSIGIALLGFFPERQDRAG